MTNEVETDEAAARRFAMELERLQSGLAKLGFYPAPGTPVGTAAVDTALEVAKNCREKHGPSLRRAKDTRVN